MRAEDMRGHIKKAYGNAKSWCEKVNEMSDSQIIALYNSLVKQGKIKN